MLLRFFHQTKIKVYQHFYEHGRFVQTKSRLENDAVMLLADAIERAQSLDTKKIRDAIAATKNFMGATGKISFDDNGDPLNKDVMIIKFDKGVSNFVKAIKP